MTTKKNTNTSMKSINSTIYFLFLSFILVVISVSNVKKSHWPIATNYRRSIIVQKDHSSCNFFSGEWVYDNSTQPLYSGLSCSFMNDEVNCDKYGRNDSKYKYWRWQPDECTLPRIDVKELLERLRGKRMVFVGDSLNRNQWVSMVCILESVIDSKHKSLAYNGSLISFKAEKYNASIDFYWSPLLLESNCDHPYNHRIEDRIIRANAIEKHAEHWKDADVLIFNSYLWWKKPRLKLKVLHGSFNDTEKKYDEMEMIEGFELALDTWKQWVESHIGSLKTRIFFTTLSPTHVWAEEWGGSSNRSCYNETEPITKKGYTGRGSDSRFTHAIEVKIEELKKKGMNVQMLNITELSEYRKDGHPTIYRKQWNALTEDQIANPSSYADCNHWCLPGIPDVWNQIMYAYIVSR